jgi:hypothetical protein
MLALFTIVPQTIAVSSIIQWTNHRTMPDCIARGEYNMTALRVVIVLCLACLAKAEVVYIPTTVGLAADRAVSLDCINNLKQIALAARHSQSEHGQFPGGFEMLTNDLVFPSPLCCPADYRDVCPNSFDEIDWSTIDYQWLQGFDPNNEQSVFAQCRIHGNIARISGVVERQQDFRDGWPEVVAHPLSASATPGALVRFAVHLAPTTLQPVRFQWQRVDVLWTTNVTFVEDPNYPGGGFWHTNRRSSLQPTPLAFGGDDVYYIETADSSDTGLYRVSISNAMGVAVSSTARLTVTNNVVNPRTDAAAAETSCKINLRGIGLAARMWGDDRQRLPASFAELTNRHGFSMLQWPLILYCPADTQRNPPANWSGVDFNNTSYELTQPPPAIDDTHASLCRCKVHGFYVDVGRAVITSNGPPAITQQPQGATVFPGSSFSFFVSVNGPGPFTYRWFKDGSVISSDAQGTLIIDNIQPEHAGAYRVEVTNPFGNVVSSNAILTVAAPLILRDATLRPDGSFQYAVLGIAGESFVLEASPDLVSWVPIRTNVVPASSVFQFTEPQPASRKFYRARP